MVLLQHITYNSLLSSLILGLLVGGLVIAFPTEILELSGAEHTVAVHGAPYFQVLIGCVIFSSIASGLTSILNGLKETKSVTIAAVCMVTTHIVLGCLAVKVFDLGLRGVAGANVVAIVVQVAILAYMVYRRVFPKRLVSLHPDWRYQWDTLKDAWPSILDKMSFQVCIALFWHVLQSHGSDIMASQRMANQITLVPLAIITGLYPVIGAYISSYYGDEQYKEIRRFTSATLVVGTFISVVVLMGTYFISPWVTTVFFTVNDKSLVEMTQTWLLFLVVVHGSNQTLQFLTHSLKAVKSKKIILISALMGHGTWGSILLFWGKDMDLLWVSSLQVLATLVKIILLGWYFYTDRWVPKPYKPSSAVCLLLGWYFYFQRWMSLTPKQRPVMVTEYLQLER
jgi:Na+-driven multidrug efflux pump